MYKRQAIHPDAAEICNDVDDDCDGLTDDEDDSVDLADAGTFYLDADADGYGDNDASILACRAPDGYRLNNDDCDDSRDDVHPTAQEVCNDIDDDCDGLIDDADDGVDLTTARDWYADTDGDGYGDPASTSQSCSEPSGFVDDDTDCNDTRGDVNPGATEVCDADDVDEDCDGTADDDDTDVDLATGSTWFPDGDRDGYGDSSDAGTASCDDPSTATAPFVADSSDCDDERDDIHPGATEVCDADDTDEDCDGTADDGDADVDLTTGTDWFPDADGDGYGDATATAAAWCDDPSTATDMFVVDATDCDDARTDVNPAASEVCDADDTDEDCDGIADDADSDVVLASGSLWYPDNDSDGYGDASDSGTLYCDDPSAGAEIWLEDDSDCDDTNARINPGSPEICDGLDNDCDATTSEAGSASFLDGSGAWTDVTSTYTGTSGSPVTGDLATDGTMYVCEGTWYWNLGVTAASVDIVGVAGATSTIIDGDASDSVFRVASASNLGLNGLTIQNGAGPNGGGILVQGGTLVADDIVLTGNASGSTGFGGGLYLDGGAASVNASTISDNTANRGAGTFATGSAYLELIDSTVEDNISSYWGGGIEVYDAAELYLVDSLVTRNTAAEYGGGIECNSGGMITVESSELTINEATSYDGGGIDLYGCELSIEDTLLEGNTAGDAGGGIYASSDADIVADGLELASNAAYHGGGLAALGGVEISDSDIYTNAAVGDGGGVWLESSGELINFTSVDFSANTPQSVWSENAEAAYTYGLGSSFACNASGCF